MELQAFRKSELAQNLSQNVQVLPRKSLHSCTDYFEKTEEERPEPSPHHPEKAYSNDSELIESVLIDKYHSHSFITQPFFEALFRFFR